MAEALITGELLVLYIHSGAGNDHGILINPIHILLLEDCLFDLIAKIALMSLTDALVIFGQTRRIFVL